MLVTPQGAVPSKHSDTVLLPSHCPPRTSSLSQLSWDSRTPQGPCLPGTRAQLLQAGEGMDGSPASPLFPANPDLLQASKLLHLGLELLDLGLQALDGLRQPEMG